MEVQLSPTQYNSGYHISCYGGNNGKINTVVIGGTAPFSYLWSNGETTQLINHLVSGTYTVTVTQSGGSTASASIFLRQPSLLDPSLYSELYPGGTNISVSGGNDGSIELTDQGGTPPYEYLWSNNSPEQNLYELTAGTYTVTVTDKNACSVTRDITLTEPGPLTVSSITSPAFHGYNLHCAGGNDGSIALTVTGGIPPYEFYWNNGSFDEDPAGLTAGHYSVRVIDQNNNQVEASITLTAPYAMNLELVPFLYANNYHISLFGGYDGSITTNISGGVSPYTFLWNDGNTLQNRTALNHGNKAISITDNNGCTIESEVMLLEPASSDWMMNGNANINATTQFIGTTDSSDFVFKTNNDERLRLDATGNVKIKNLESTTTGLDLVFVDKFGALKRQVSTCQPLSTPWLQGGNNITSLNSWERLIGTCSNHDFNIITNSEIRIAVSPTGNVGIGTTVPKNALDLNGSMVIGNGYAGSITAAAGTDLLVAGNVGIGTTTPSANFQIGNDFVFIKGNNTSISNAIGFNFFNNNGNAIKLNSNLAASCIEFSGDPNHDGNIRIKGMQAANTQWNDLKTTFYSDGRVYIGTGEYNPQNINSNSPYYSVLSVEGTILSSEVRVKNSINWPDYVFDENYNLPELNQTEKFIKENHHLPDMPTAFEIDKNGQELGNINGLLLKKIEEITLYVIDLNKKNEKLTKEVNDLKRKK